MAEQINRKLIEAACATIAAHADELTRLDQAIGDGDHGTNMRRGFDAIAEAGDEIAGLPLDKALQKAGMTLVMKVGGASGPLYGTLLMEMGKACTRPPAGAADLAALLDAGVAGVKARGKSDVGAKTMLDVLAPVAACLAEAGDDPLDAVRTCADRAVEATRDMKATKGRASFLGDRSVGHIDPGAKSSALLIHAACDVLEAP